MLWFPNEASYCAEKLYTDINMPPLLPDEDKNFGGSLVLDFRKWWRQVKTIYSLIIFEARRSQTSFVTVRASCKVKPKFFQFVFCDLC